MMPIHELLAKIKFDENFSKDSDFEIGYYDRVLDKIIFIDYLYLEFDDNYIKFRDETRRFRKVPFHRIKIVKKDGEIIWNRER